MANLCIIPARGGSRRIPRKNIRNFLGKPIIAYSIETALRSGLFEEVMVSTDDEEIAEISRQYGAQVPFLRSKQNSDDFATTLDVLLEVVNEYRILKIDFKNICCIYPTAPLILQHDLKSGYDKLINEKWSSVFPVVKFSYPIWRGLQILKNKKIQMIWSEYVDTCSQDLSEVYHDAGQWYWIELKEMVKSKQIMSDNSSFVELSPMKVQDVDQEADWQMAELKYGVLQSLKQADFFQG